MGFGSGRGERGRGRVALRSGIMEWQRSGYTVSDDPTRLDRDVIHTFLVTAYWSRGIPRDVVERSIAGSMPFGLYAPDGRQVGFARAVTDRATFCWVGDVFVLPEERGRGLGVWLMETVVAHPELQGLRRWLLATRDAHELYRKIGFESIEEPGRLMVRSGDPGYGTSSSEPIGGTNEPDSPKPTGVHDNGDDMRVSAKADYALRAAAELAAATESKPLKAERIAEAQEIPIKFLESILLELKHAGIVRSQRGAEGGYLLALQASQISLADVIRAVDGPLANVRGDRPENVTYRGAAIRLTDVWIAVRASLRHVLESTSLADLSSGHLPEIVEELAKDPKAWVSLGRIQGTATG